MKNIDHDKPNVCIKTEEGTLICGEEVFDYRGIGNKNDSNIIFPKKVKWYIGIAGVFLIMFFAFIGALGADIISLVIVGLGIFATIGSIAFIFIAFSYKIYLGVIATVGFALMLWLLWWFVFLPAWIALGNSLVLAFQNFIGLF
jgi:hypothetical protein